MNVNDIVVFKPLPSTCMDRGSPLKAGDIGKVVLVKQDHSSWPIHVVWLGHAIKEDEPDYEGWFEPFRPEELEVIYEI